MLKLEFIIVHDPLAVNNRKEEFTTARWRSANVWEATDVRFFAKENDTVSPSVAVSVAAKYRWDTTNMFSSMVRYAAGRLSPCIAMCVMFVYLSQLETINSTGLSKVHGGAVPRHSVRDLRESHRL